MKVFKFGGASVKDATSVRNVVNVLRKVGYADTLVVISAMGKTTNAMEDILLEYTKEASSLKDAIARVKVFHFTIISELFSNPGHAVVAKANALFEDLFTFLDRNKSPNYDYIYDQVVGFGELLSTTIVSEYFKEEGVQNIWLDARAVIKTDSTYRDAGIEWETTQALVNKNVQKGALTITQGFIGSDANNFSTTLGREGSDYTAAIFAYCLNAESVSIWKDVPGVLNGDPRVFEGTQLLHQISYEEAIELAFYGASVIHPKTLQPLQRKEIPLYVKSFIDPEAAGTAVRKGQLLDPMVPCFIVKKNQVLISLSTLDFSFVVEENVSHIFQLFHEYQMKVDLIQNSAISFTVCLDNKFDNLPALVAKLKATFSVSYHENVSLYTIRHYTKEAIKNLEKGKTILCKQTTANTYQIVVKEA